MSWRGTEIRAEVDHWEQRYEQVAALAVVHPIGSTGNT
jgi:hypothetical protein